MDIPHQTHYHPTPKEVGFLVRKFCKVKIVKKHTKREYKPQWFWSLLFYCCIRGCECFCNNWCIKSRINWVGYNGWCKVSN